MVIIAVKLQFVKKKREKQSIWEMLFPGPGCAYRLSFARPGLC